MQSALNIFFRRLSVNSNWHLWRNICYSKSKLYRKRKSCIFIWILSVIKYNLIHVFYGVMAYLRIPYVCILSLWRIDSILELMEPCCYESIQCYIKTVTPMSTELKRYKSLISRIDQRQSCFHSIHKNCQPLILRISVTDWLVRFGMIRVTKYSISESVDFQEYIRLLECHYSTWFRCPSNHFWIEKKYFPYSDECGEWLLLLCTFYWELTCW